MPWPTDRIPGLPPLSSLRPEPPKVVLPAPAAPPLATATSGATVDLGAAGDQVVEWTPEPLSWGQQLGFASAEVRPLPEPEPGATTLGQYAFGPPTRPPIRHDNGFLQNPRDKLDPVPLPTRPPTASDYLHLAKWHTILEGSEAFRPDLEDGNRAYRHFLEGGGRDLKVDYDRFLRGDPAGQVVLEVATRDAELTAQRFYDRLIAVAPERADEAVRFSFTGSEIRVGAAPEPGQASTPLPYPEEENWAKALGAHSVWLSADVVVTPSPEGPQFDVQLTIHAEDCFNFNPGDQDVATGIVDSENGRLEASGLGRQFMTYGEARRRLSWSRTDNPAHGRTQRADGVRRHQGPREARMGPAR